MKTAYNNRFSALNEVTKKEKEEEFSYCIGHPWDKEKPNNICTYAFGSTVFSGTLKSAKRIAKLMADRNGLKKLNIYKLVEI